MTELHPEKSEEHHKMHTIEVRVPIPAELLERLDARATEATGGDRGEYIKGLIQKDLEGQSLRDIFAPVPRPERGRSLRQSPALDARTTSSDTLMPFARS